VRCDQNSGTEIGISGEGWRGKGVPITREAEHGHVNAVRSLRSGIVAPPGAPVGGKGNVTVSPAISGPEAAVSGVAMLSTIPGIEDTGRSTASGASTM
jgi:hypothetical protein